MKIPKCLRFIRIGCLCLVVGLSSLSGFAAQLTNITLTQMDKKTTLYCAINGSFTHKIFTLPNPNRVVIDLSNTSIGVNVKQLNLRNGVVKQGRSGVLDPKTTRLVFDVTQRVGVSSSPWFDHGLIKGVKIDLISNGSVTNSTVRNPYSRVRPNKVVKQVQFHTTKLTAQQQPHYQETPTKLSNVVQQPRITHKTPVKVSHSPSKSFRDVIVVLDAGHGGKDPGARGPRNSKEKHVVLAITLKLKQLIDRQPGMHAVLTRSGDYYVGLRQRLKIARKYNGDIFVSIHADAFNNPHSNGASVFALSQGGATSEAARWIAEKENYSELGGVNLGDLDDTNGVVRSVLIDLSQTATINSSLQMGGRVLSQLDGFTRLHNNKVEQARFMVLKSPDIPSILVETGFISNPIEERNLTSSAYQSRLSQALFHGIKGYFWSNPPHGTRIEAMATNALHVVRAGETLPVIAARYRVSLNAIRSTNHLSGGSTLKPGQKLVIPSTWA